MIEGDSSPSRRFVSQPFIGLGLILGLAFALYSPSLLLPHNEYDEIIYSTLAEKVAHRWTDYSLQGTPVLEELPKVTYDHPVFHRPPFFVYLLSLFRSVHPRAGALLPVFCGLGVIWLTFLLGRRGDEATGLCAAALAALSPLLIFGSTRILMDALLTLEVAAVVAVTRISAQKRSLAGVIAAGVILGLGMLTKETALFIVPTCVYLFFREEKRVPATVNVLIFLGAAFAVSFPWYYYFKSVMGTFFQQVGKTDLDASIQMFPFMAQVVGRSWHFYFSHGLLIAPVFIFAFAEMVRRAKNREPLTETIWALSYLLALTFYSLQGNGYQMRYVLPAIPALCLLSAGAIGQAGPRARWAAVAFVCYGLWNGVMNGLLFKSPEVYPAFVFFR